MCREGGAGTWSDGKLTTRIGRNSGAVRTVLQAFVDFGAPPEILVSGKPHLGTDRMVRILQGFRTRLREPTIPCHASDKNPPLLSPVFSPILSLASTSPFSIASLPSCPPTCIHLLSLFHRLSSLLSSHLPPTTSPCHSPHWFPVLSFTFPLSPFLLGLIFSCVVSHPAEALGVDVRFGETVEDVIMEGGSVRGVKLKGGETVRGSRVVLAVGHSARPLYEVRRRQR